MTKVRGNKVDLRCGSPSDFEAACERTDLRSLTVWNCKVRDFSPLVKLTKLTALQIMDFRGELELLSGLTALRSLELVRVSQLSSLEPLANLPQLRLLSIEPRGGNPLTDRTTPVESLEPLVKLGRLEHLTLMRISVTKGGLRPLAGLRRLRTFECSNVFPLSEIAGLKGRCPRLQGGCVQPFLEIPIPCGRCSENKVRLNGTGIGRIRLICPRCKALRVAEHTELFNRLAAAAT